MTSRPVCGLWYLGIWLQVAAVAAAAAAAVAVSSSSKRLATATVTAEVAMVGAAVVAARIS